MMNAYRDNRIVLTMSPKELRGLADKMDELWAKMQIGQTTFVDILSCKDPIIHLHLDQEYYHKLGKTN